MNDASRSVDLHYALCDIIAVDNQPFRIVHDIGFKNCMMKAQPQYQMSSRNYLIDIIMPDIYSKCKSKISSDISMAEDISVIYNKS